MSPRTGRPKAESPKSYSIKVRFDESMHNELTEYCKKNNVTRTEVIRQATKLLLSKEK